MQKDKTAITKVFAASIGSGASTFLSLYAAEIIFTFWLGKKIRTERILAFLSAYVAVGVLLGGCVAALFAVVARPGRKRSPDVGALLYALNSSIFAFGLAALALNTSFLPRQSVFSAGSLLASLTALLFSAVLFSILYRTARPRGTSIPLWQTVSACSFAGFLFGLMHTPVSRMIGRNGTAISWAILLALGFMAAAVAAMLVESRLINGLAKRGGGESGFKKVFLVKASGIATVMIVLFVTSRYRPLISDGKKVRQPVHSRQRPNIIFMVMDTVRQDRLSLYGCERETSPNLSKLAEEAWVFDGYSTISWTLPSHASMVTGRYPTETGAGLSGSLYIDERNETLAEVLRDHGYSTAAVIANWGVLSELSGFQQGFDYYFAKPRETDLPFRILAASLLEKVMLDSRVNTIMFYERAERVNAEALRWIRERSEEPFFLFINYMDAHDPYVPPAPYDRRWYNKTRPSNLGGGVWLGDLMAKIQNNEDIDTEIEYLLSQYDGEIAYLDSQIGAFLDQLRKMNLFEDSLIIVTSDHGEFFAEHGLLHHPPVVYQQALKVPLLIKPPAGRKAEKRQMLFSLIQLFPLILRYAGIPDHSELREPSPTVFSEGHSIGDAAFMERFGTAMYSVVQYNYKLIYSSNGTYEFYDLSSDPLEERNLWGEPLEPDARQLGEDMRELLALQIDTINAGRMTVSGLDSESQEQIRDNLKALGYIQ